MLAKILFTILLTLSAPFAGASQPLGEGMPLPWPFPWAEDCPVLWSTITGRYVMQDSHDNEMELQISIIRKEGLRLVHISHFTKDGDLLSDGFAFLTLNQKVVNVHMKPKPGRVRVNPLWASIKFYYGSEDLSCQMETLVPILSMVEQKPGHNEEVQYRLIRQNPLYR